MELEASMLMIKVHNYPRFFHRLVLSILLILLLTFAACSGSTTTTSGATPASPAATTTSNPEETGTTTPPTSLAPTASGYPIKVFFSKFPDSVESNVNAVFPVDRISPTIAVGTFAIQLLIAGPTPQEWDQGYFSELNSVLTGPSNCSTPHPTGGPDFKLTLDMKGPKPQKGTATLKFCRMTASPGTGADARIQSEINATLKQFSSIKKVAILTEDGHCFGDESGLDLCLK
jgi:hypothetical protein